MGFIFKSSLSLQNLFNFLRESPLSTLITQDPLTINQCKELSHVHIVSGEVSCQVCLLLSSARGTRTSHLQLHFHLLSTSLPSAVSLTRNHKGRQECGPQEGWFLQVGNYPGWLDAEFFHVPPMVFSTTSYHIARKWNPVLK